VGLRRKILVVDDVEYNVLLLVDSLAILGFDVSQASNGEEALEVAVRFRPELIVMDLAMPVMDGFEATRRLRLMPDFAEVPIIATSASATQDVQARCHAAGANAFIAKPIEQDLLLDTIGRLMDLTWVREDTAVPSAERADGHTSFVSPPPDEVLVLRGLARTGNMRAIRERADHLRQLDARYGPVAARLSLLAERCESKAIVALVERLGAPADEG
jgi:CheY-like chemotaxis protein